MSEQTTLVLEFLLADFGSIIMEVLGRNKDDTQRIDHDGLT